MTFEDRQVIKSISEAIRFKVILNALIAHQGGNIEDLVKKATVLARV
jgi:hypothetical protein